MLYPNSAFLMLNSALKSGSYEGLPSNYHSSVSAGDSPGICCTSPHCTDQGSVLVPQASDLLLSTVKSIVLDVAGREKALLITVSRATKQCCQLYLHLHASLHQACPLQLIASKKKA